MKITEVTAPLPKGPGLLMNILPAVVVVWGFVGVYLLQLAIDSTSRRQGERLMQELAYFPSGVALREAAIEYREIVADFIWLTAIDYYGRHQETDRRYEWLGHIFEILTTLDPRFVGAYHFADRQPVLNHSAPFCSLSFSLLTSGAYAKAKTRRQQQPRLEQSGY